MGRRPADLSGRKFGMLTAKYATEKRDKRGSVYWHCVCDCGNEVDVTAAGLVHGNYHSCGCLQKKNRQEIAQRRHLVDGTCVEVLEKRKSRKDNMSGFRGVFQLKNCNRYRVDIGFKGKRYYVGLFDNYDEAVQARLFLCCRILSARHSHLTHSPESPHPLSSHQTQADAPSPTPDLPSPSHSILSISE